MKYLILLLVAFSLQAECIVKTIWIEGNPTIITECY